MPCKASFARDLKKAFGHCWYYCSSIQFVIVLQGAESESRLHASFNERRIPYNCRCVGDLIKVSDSCSDKGSELATIESSGRRTIFRFVPVEGDESVRIIVKDVKGGCNRFLSAVSNCEDPSVYLSKEDYREGLQRWIITKAYEAPKVTSATASGPSTATVTFQPTADAVECTVRLSPGNVQQTVSPITFPTSTAAFESLDASTTYSASVACTMLDGYETSESEAIEFTTDDNQEVPTPAPEVPTPAPELPTIEIVSAEATGGTTAQITFKLSQPAPECSVILMPQGKNSGVIQTLSPVSFPTDTANVVGLNPATVYSASVMCSMQDGCQCAESAAESFTTPQIATSAPVYPPSSGSPSLSYCDGFGEISTIDGLCVCDEGAGFMPNGRGGCKCPQGWGYDALVKECKDCTGFGQIVDASGYCVCDTEDAVNGPFVPNGEGGCQCEKYFDLGDGTCGCKPNCVVLADAGSCDCGVYVLFFEQWFGTSSPGYSFFYQIVAEPGVEGVASTFSGFEEPFKTSSFGFYQSPTFDEYDVEDRKMIVPLTGEVTDRAIRIKYEPTDKVNVFSIQYMVYSSDITAVLNGDQLGKEYLVLTGPVSDRNDRPLFFSVTAVDYNTVVQITPTKDLNTTETRDAGVPFNITLEKPGDAIAFSTLDPDEEPTGTHIVASSPVVVVSGNQCADIPPDLGWCDITMSQIFPVKDFGTEYILVSTRRPNGDFVRVLASEDDTEVFIDGVSEGVLNRGEVLSKDGVQNIFIRATKPVLVGQFLRGGDDVDNVGDPAFSVVLSKSQWYTSYVYANIPSLDGDPYLNQINVVIPNSKKDSLRLNGFPIPAEYIIGSDTIDGYFFVNFDSSALDAHGTISADVPFMAMISGTRQDNSYLTYLLE